jgi:hypothetical protein
VKRAVESSPAYSLCGWSGCFGCAVGHIGAALRRYIRPRDVPEDHKYIKRKTFLVIGPLALSVCLRISKNAEFAVLHMSPTNARYPRTSVVVVSMWPNIDRIFR